MTTDPTLNALLELEDVRARAALLGYRLVPHSESPGARATDPDTSKAATRLRSTSQRYRLLRTYRDAAEARFYVGLTDEQAGLRTGIRQAWKRCADLRSVGWIEDTGMRVTSDSGTHVMVCRITDKGRDALRDAA